jgi:arginase family enzyme
LGATTSVVAAAAGRTVATSSSSRPRHHGWRADDYRRADDHGRRRVPARHPRPQRRRRARLPSDDGTVTAAVIDSTCWTPETFASVGAPEPDGVTPAQLVSAVRALIDRYPLAGLGITEYEPERASDRAVLVELIPALLVGAR